MVWRKFFVRAQLSDRLGRKPGIGMGESARFRIQRIISLLDLIAVKDDALGLGSDAVHLAQNSLYGIVCHRIIGKKSRYIVDEYVHGLLFTR